MMYLHSIGTIVKSTTSSLSGYASSTVSHMLGKTYEVLGSATSKTIGVMKAVAEKTAIASQVYRIYQDPNKVVNHHIHEAGKGIHLKDLLETGKETTKTICKSIKARKNTWVERVIVYFAEKHCSKPPASQKKINEIAKKLGTMATATRAKTAFGSLIDNAPGILRSVATLATLTADGDQNTKQARIRNHFGVSDKLTFDEAKKQTKKTVHKNLCSLLELQRKKENCFTLNHLIACICYLAVKFLKSDIYALDNVFYIGMESLLALPELAQRLGGCEEFIFLKALEIATTDLLNEQGFIALLNKQTFTDEEINQKWKKFVRDTSPIIDEFATSKIPEENRILAVVASVAIDMFGGASKHFLSRIDPLQVIPVAIQASQNILKTTDR